MENERRIHNRRKYLQNIQWAKDEYPEYLKNSYISIRKKNPVQELANAFPKGENTDG